MSQQSQQSQQSQPATIQCSSVSFTYPQAAAPLFSDATFTLSKGWTAVLGDNGIGKTTLMRIVTGDLRPDSNHGSIMPDPASVVSAYCEQRIDTSPRNLDAFANDWSQETMAIKRLLNIGDDWPYRYDTLSGGEAKRLQIACTLSVRPDLLILDEPTNHVDEPTRRAVVTALRGYRGIGVIVSHDPELIDAICAQCLWFRRRHVRGTNITVVESYPGGYTHSAVQIEHADGRADRELEQAKAEHTRLHAIRSQRFQAVQHAQALKQKEGFRIDPHDHDALNKRKGAKSGSVDGHSARAYARMEGQVDRARQRVEAVSVSAKRYDGDIWFRDADSAHGELVRLEPGIIIFGEDHVRTADMAVDGGRTASDAGGGVGGVSGDIGGVAGGGIGGDVSSIANPDACDRPGDDVEDVDSSRDAGKYARLVIDGQEGGGEQRNRSRDQSEQCAEGDDDHPVGLRIPMLSVGPRDHIGVSGPNGLGKTTLINVVLQSLVDVPRLVIGQTLPSDAGRRALARLRGLHPELRSQVMNAYARLNSDPVRLLDGQGSEEPSPGELRKLLLCMGIIDKPRLIVMDEPTNHLDLSSKRALASALRGFAGAVILVSHEAWFLDATTDIRWAVDR